jgi:hypothetical protein
LKFGDKHTVWLTTRLGHIFEIVDEKTKQIMGKYSVQHDSFFVIGSTTSKGSPRDITDNVKRTFEGEWQRSRNVKRTFTELGFTLGKLPPDLWGSMSAYYYNNRENKVREEWDSKGTYVHTLSLVCLPDYLHEILFSCFSIIPLFKLLFHVIFIFLLFYFTDIQEYS